MAAATTTAVIEGLKYTYGVNKVLYLFNQESVMYNRLSKVKKPVGGRGQFLMPTWVKNAGAFGGITEGGSLPTALAPDTAEASFSLQEYVGMCELTWKLIQDSSKDKFAFQQALTMVDDSFKRRYLRMLNMDFIGDGRGALAYLPAADNTSPITVNSLPGVETGLVVDIMDDTDDDTKLADSVTITGVDVINRTISTSGNPSGTAAGDYFVIQDTTDVSISNSLHTNGIRTIISNANPNAVVGNFGGINRSTAGNEYWQAYVSSNSGTNRPLTEDLLLTAMDTTREKGGGMLDTWLSNLALQRRYHEMLAGERYFALSAPGVLEGGIGRREKKPAEDGLTPYEFSGIPWYVDPYFAANTLIGMDSSHFFIGVGDNDVPRPISEVFDNVPFFRQTTSATFEIAFYYQCEVLSDNPAAGCQIKDISES